MSKYNNRYGRKVKWNLLTVREYEEWSTCPVSKYRNRYGRKVKWTLLTVREYEEWKKPGTLIHPFLKDSCEKMFIGG